VVIIGVGAAGAMAAIYAQRAYPKIRLTVLDKSKMETSGAAGRDMDHSRQAKKICDRSSRV
jgi:thioredoxin reductase